MNKSTKRVRRKTSKKTGKGNPCDTTRRYVKDKWREGKPSNPYRADIREDLATFMTDGRYYSMKMEGKLS